MADPTKAELQGDLEKRLRTVENEASQAKGAVGAWKWVAGISIPIAVIALAAAVSSFFELRGTTAARNEESKALKELLVELQKDVRESAREFRKELKDNDQDLRKQLQETDRLARHLAGLVDQGVVIQRTSHMNGDGGGAPYSAGEIAKITGDKIVIVDDRKKEATYTLDPLAVVTIRGKSARLEDLKPGMHVHFNTSLADGSRIFLIQNIDHSQDSPRLPPPLLKGPQTPQAPAVPAPASPGDRR